MLTQFINLSSWREQNITIKPNEVFDVNFKDTTPNMFVIINPNPARIKGSIGAIPRVDNFEFMADYNSMETFGRPSGTQHLYLLNDSSINVNLKLFSINKDFDPVVLKNMRVSLEGYKIESNTEITGVVGGVELPVKLNTTQNKNISDMLTAFTNLIKKGTTSNVVGLYDLKTLLESILNKKLVKENIDYKDNCNTYSYQANKECVFCFEWLFNDGDNATIYITRSGNKTALFTIKTDEGFGDIEIELKANDKLSIETDNGVMSMRLKTYTKTA